MDEVSTPPEPSAEESSWELSQDSTGWISVAEGARLFLRRWASKDAARSGGEETPRAALHIVHGMAEHSLRYERLARRLCAEGIEVWAADQRGHGLTADLKVNGPGIGGLRGHCADHDGFSLVTSDVDAVNRLIRRLRPGIPLFLLGHSWGSFVVQNYIENYTGIDGCILSGTRGPDGIKIKIGAPGMAFISALRGKRKGSIISHAIADGPYNKPFRPNRTSFDWLSRDEKEVDAFITDPLSGNLSSSGFYRDLLGGLNRIHRSEAMEKIDRRLPIYVFGGSADPVGEMGASPTALVDAYRALGIQDLEFVLYPDARHETLNETNREEVTGNLLSWILKHIH
ncbi:hydrolase [Spirochaetia bacterium]|nr:hydrolase [Spirochaetia bacterium]